MTAQAALHTPLRVRSRVAWAVGLLVALAFAGCLDDDADDPDPGNGSSFGGPNRPGFESGNAVVAVIDTGVNPYHEDFRDENRTWRAAERVPGYPQDGRVLPLTLDQSAYADAVSADEPLWELLEEGIIHDVPGTAIVGMVGFGGPAPHPDAPVTAVGLDEDGHGTASAGMVRSACPECLLVTVETGGATDGRTALAWAAAQSWIDVVVYPARAGIGFTGAATYLVDPGTEFAWARDNAEAGQVVVVASGNGLQTVPVAGASTAYTPARDVSYSYWTAGPDWVVTVGASEPVSGAASAWHTYPVDVIAPGRSCDAPHPFSVDARVVFEGTSCSAPVVGGQMAGVLRAARDVLVDGATGPRSGQRLAIPEDPTRLEVTREDLTRAYLLTAGRIDQAAPVGIPDPTDPAGWTIGDGPLSPVHAGWGLHDEATLAAAVAVLVGDEAAPSPEDDEAAWFPVDQRVRGLAWGPWDRGTSRIDFPEPLVGPVVLPGSPSEVMELYAASQALSSVA